MPVKMPWYALDGKKRQDPYLVIRVLPERDIFYNDGFQIWSKAQLLFIWPPMMHI
jgi:hypothetical protein